MIPGTIFIRWKDGEARTGRVLPPPRPDRPEVADEPCIACGEALSAGPITLLIIGPSADPEAQEKHREGRWYSAAAWPVHAACAGTEPKEDD